MVLAFRDIAPQAPTHILINPKFRDELTGLSKTKFILPASTQEWVLQSVRDAWNRFKTKIKHKHFLPYENVEDILKNRPKQVPPSEFIRLILYWSHPLIQDNDEDIHEIKLLVIIMAFSMQG
ncbi:hypothetical protein PIB30_082062 [Stylosanthes scabra]|uniref:Uncharacterized protein n=1 Tax=Stylosanthes scabra TaxID=79078 RepID=A0ABU6RRQ5_9FABA|nr:hypothetical protein [Stylosanthes scabra]